MNDTNADLGDIIGRQLRAASSRFDAPVGLSLRVTERERDHQRRRASRRVGTVGIAVAATVGGLVWVQNARGSATSTASQPAPAVSALAPSPNSGRIDFFPVITWPAEPIPGVGASYSYHDDDQGWGGALGVPNPDGAPSSIVGVRVYSAEWTVFPAAVPGRFPGVLELPWGDGAATLVVPVDDLYVVVYGDDIDLLYALVEFVEPVVTDGQLAGYRFSDTLPAGLVELEPPQHSVPMVTPSLSTDDGTFSVTILEGSVLANVAGLQVEAVTISGRNGYRTTAGTPTIAIAVSTDETLYLSASNLTIEQLTEIAQHITLVDETEWTTDYGVEIPD